MKRLCPKCGRDNSCQAPVNDPSGIQEPRSGDLSICLYCLAPLIYNPDLSLRLITRKEFSQIGKADPDLLIQLVEAQAIAKKVLTEKKS